MVKQFVIFIFLIVFAQSLSAQTPYRAESIPMFISKSTIDSIACIERTASYYFHCILNNYRKSKGLELLHWNDTLWIAGMNHSLWMNRQHELTHVERGKTWYFTGRHVGDRVCMRAMEMNTYTGAQRTPCTILQRRETIFQPLH